MKTTKFLAVMAITTLISYTSCTKDDSDISEEAITEEVAEDIAASLGTSNYGITGEIVEVAETSSASEPETKSASVDTIYYYKTNYNISNPSGTLITYDYFCQIEYGYTMENYMLNSFFYNSTLEGSFDAPRISSTEGRTSSFDVTGWDLSSQEYVYNGSIKRTGNSQSKVRNKSTINSSSQITLIDLKVNKSSFEITEGTLSYKISGTVNDQHFDYSATVTYLGNGKAELYINGQYYTIDISSGEIDD